MKKVLSIITNQWGVAIVFIVSVITILPLLQSGFFPMHDNTQVARIYEMGKALKDGMFPVRWVDDLGYGYGYPIFNFYAPLAYYIGGIGVVIGLDALIATKIVFGVALLLAGIGMYFFIKNIWGNWAGIIGGISYQFASYHAINAYVRGDLAELLAYGIAPFVFLGIYHILTTKKYLWFWLATTAISYAALICSHNLTALMLTPIYILFGVILIVSSPRKLFLSYIFIGTFLIGFLISAAYWLPVLGEMQYTNVLSQVGGGADFRDHFVCLQQFWYSSWGYGGSTKGCVDGISFAFGKIYFLLIGISIVSLIVFWKKHTHQLISLFALTIGLISLFLQTQYSQLIWEFIKPMAFFQYPWRFLLLTNICISLVLGSLVYIITTGIKQTVVTVGICISIVLAISIQQSKLFIPQTIFPVQSDAYTNTTQLRFTTSKISDEYMPTQFHIPSSLNEVPQKTFTISPQTGKILTQMNKTQQKTANIQIVQPAQMTINLAYFPAWHLYLDGKEQPIKSVSNGITIYMPKGLHTITLLFMSTPLETIANMLSLAGILLLVIGIIWGKRHFNYGTTSS